MLNDNYSCEPSMCTVRVSANRHSNHGILVTDITRYHLYHRDFVYMYSAIVNVYTVDSTGVMIHKYVVYVVLIALMVCSFPEEQQKTILLLEEDSIDSIHS